MSWDLNIGSIPYIIINLNVFSILSMDTIFISSDNFGCSRFTVYCFTEHAVKLVLYANDFTVLNMTGNISS